MKLIRIFVSDISEAGLWSVQLGKEPQNEFDKFFDLMNDVEWLYNFFAANKADLENGFFGNIDIQEAVLRTLEEIEVMEDLLYNYTEQGFAGDYNSLQHLFKPLNNFEYTIALHQKSKARNKRGWLRIYAIRIDQNCYVVTGGAIKLTQHMQGTYLQYELVKLELVKIFLRDNGIDYPEDINTCANE